MVHKLFDKKTELEVNVNEVLSQELHKPVNKKLKIRKVDDRFKDNIWAANMRTLSSFNHVAKYLLCVIDVLTKYGWVKHLGD